MTCECDVNYQRDLNNTCIAKSCDRDTDCRLGKLCKDRTCQCKEHYITNDYGYCMRPKKKEPSDNTSTIGNVFFKWFEVWSWQAYLIIVTAAIVIATLVALIIYVIVRLVQLRK